MKKLLFALPFVAIACHEPSQDPLAPNEPTSIEGLELTFIDHSITSPPVSLEFTSESTGFLSTFEGELYKTINGGESWQEISIPPGVIYDLHFKNANEGWAVGVGGNTDVGANNTLILHTTNAGESWESIPLTTAKTVPIMSVHFIDDQIGIAAGVKSVLRTIDGGETWNETIFGDLQATIQSIEFFDDKHGIISTTQKSILVTDDAGVTWNVLNDFKADALGFTNNVGFYSSEKDIFKTTDRGTTWTSIHKFDDYTSNIYSLNFITDHVGFAFGRGRWSGGDMGHDMGSLYYTKDGGQSWTGTDGVHEAFGLTRGTFPTPNVGYAIGNRTLVKIKIL